MTRTWLDFSPDEFTLLYCILFLWTVRILQHRSVAFVTYVDELNAQFAKESMACQSLDNDEILNVRCVLNLIPDVAYLDLL